MTQLLNFWKKKNLRLSEKEAKELYGINNFFSQLNSIKRHGIPIKSEIRHDLGESARRYWIDEEWREVNR